ncbi:MAG: phospholipase D-like domain-containing protein [Gammaproteobacteria bacterium]|nr:phospholipase D-like domain-containing protein [Gammaproteobacteria bacterium]
MSERIAAVRRGGEIDWVTYYFRDRRLAEELLRAHRRGVRVRLTIEKTPRLRHANERVLSMLRGPDGLGEGLRAISHRLLPGLRWKPHLHEKIYCFSEPKPVAFVGSFNPSGDVPEAEPQIINDIMDHDRGHNALVALHERDLVNGLTEHARRMHTAPHGILERFDRTMNQPIGAEETVIHFLPRLGPDPVSALLARFGNGAKAKFAASHIKGWGATSGFVGLARRGADVEVLAEDSRRRVPPSIDRQLADAGVKLTRFPHRTNLPMHHKFALIEDQRGCWTAFGSYNWTTRSRWLNHEVCVITPDRDLFEAFAERWEVLTDLAAGATVEA